MAPLNCESDHPWTFSTKELETNLEDYGLPTWHQHQKKKEERTQSQFVFTVKKKGIMFPVLLLLLLVRLVIPGIRSLTFQPFLEKCQKRFIS